MFRTLLSALTFVVALSFAVADPIIVSDLQSGGQFTLPTGYGGTVYDATYDTSAYTYSAFNSASNPGAGMGAATRMRSNYVLLNISWAGDAAGDRYSFVTPIGLNVSQVVGDAPACTISGTTTLSTTLRYCTYNLSWSAPFTGTFAVAYSNASNTLGSETIDILFTNPLVLSSTGTRIIGDPQFVGLRGQSYQVHGVDGAVYNLITESNTQVNSRFVFLTAGECPMINGVRSTVGCWSHPGSYMGDMSFQAVVDGKLHAAMITAGSSKKGFSAVQMDGKQLALGESVSFGAFSLSYNSTHGATVTLENYNVELSNSDRFLNLALTTKVPLSQLESHGLIGQTHSTKTYKTAVKYVEGEVDDYLVTDDDLFGTDFPFNLFKQ